MAKNDPCSVQGCQQKAAAWLDASAFCRGHFISRCYEVIDQYASSVRGDRFYEMAAESMRQFLVECTRQATELSQTDEPLDNLDRARLLDILLRASDLSRFLRRSNRKEASLPVRLRCEKLGRAWEEDTTTRVLSRYGALLTLDHTVDIGETLVLTRRDTGRDVRARVAWRQPGNRGGFELGLEFLDCENFWGLDWKMEDPVFQEPEALVRHHRG